ncbi:MAG: hypothetical protein HY220_02725 [Candidatus Sungbacteria bacterium]|uniref:Uncharacterized protein n=1 Tax=Candidatus Sungiibacteriota bacterium TaxID=2750080 RepID=A0A9D6LU06_9BACT|nr:hypothetical protein [Candidatus Sungbacteria bacterium]
MLVGVGRTGAPVDYNPHLRSLSFPLWEGKRWGGVVWWTAGPESGSFSVNAQAKKWERIGVLAGTFEALRVETTTSGAQLNFWLKCWYVPEVQRFIKCDSNNARLQFELSQYGLVGSTASQ